MNRLLFTALIFGVLLPELMPPARAHVEAVEMAIDVIAERDHAIAELRVPIADLIASELPAGAVAPQNVNRDPLEVVRKHADEMLKAFRITYDTTPLQGRLTNVATKSLVIGVNGEDILPRDCGVFTMEFAGTGSIPSPQRILVRHELFKQPDEAGYQPTVACLVSFRQVSQTSTRNDVIGIDDTLTLKCQWPTEPPKMAQPAAAPLAQKAAPATPAVEETARPRSRGGLIMLGIAGTIIVVLAVVLAKKKTV